MTAGKHFSREQAGARASVFSPMTAPGSVSPGSTPGEAETAATGARIPGPAQSQLD